MLASLIRNMVLLSMIFSPFYIIGRVIYIKLKHKQFNKKREILYFIFAIYILGVLSQTIIPRLSSEIDINGDRIYIINRSINLTPFKTIRNYLPSKHVLNSNNRSTGLINIFANLLLFTPFGYLLPVVYKKVKKFYHVFVIGLVFIIFIETFQYFVGRIADIDDLILNMISISIGYVIHIILRKVTKMLNTVT